jgi:hypothetical protein
MYSINRSIAVIKPRQPLLDWLNALPDNVVIFTLAELRTDCTVLLIPEYDTDEKALNFIKKIYLDIFERELDSYCTDPDCWPSKRNYKTFMRWFDIELHSEVFDAVDKEIIKERWE